MTSYFIEDAARVLHVSRRTVFYWIGRGLLDTVQCGKTRRVTTASIAAVLAGERPISTRYRHLVRRLTGRATLHEYTKS